MTGTFGRQDDGNSLGGCMFSFIKDFFRTEAAGGMCLIAASIVALIIANSALLPHYNALLQAPFSIIIGPLAIEKSVLLVINDGLMAVFFFLVGLEIKREFVQGQLSSVNKAILPAVAAIGGMAVPALIYVGINAGDPVALNGWAIPAATDIAFALGVLAILGSRVPIAIKVLLTAIAVMDDLGAIVIIALFYTAQISMMALYIAGLALALLAVMNFMGVRRVRWYMLVGVVLWVAVLKSGVHATLAGVCLAMFIPLRVTAAEKSPLIRLEHALHPFVAFAVLPIFGFANAGVSFAGMGISSLLEPVTLGIILGLVLGKQLGIFAVIYTMVKMKFVPMVAQTTWAHVYGMSLLCGIGFTMSLFIGGLAFEDDGFAAPVRLGVLGGSLICAVTGYLVLRFFTEPAHSNK